MSFHLFEWKLSQSQIKTKYAATSAFVKRKNNLDLLSQKMMMIFQRDLDKGRVLSKKRHV